MENHLLERVSLTLQIANRIPRKAIEANYGCRLPVPSKDEDPNRPPTGEILPLPFFFSVIYNTLIRVITQVHCLLFPPVLLQLSTLFALFTFQERSLVQPLPRPEVSCPAMAIRMFQESEDTLSR